MGILNEAAKLFGFEINRPDDPAKIPSIAPQLKDDGAIIINSPGPLAAGIFLDLEGTVKNEAELITKYRDMAGHPELDMAIDEIVNEAIVSEEGEKTVEIVLDDVPVPPKIKQIIIQEFDEVLKLLEFNVMSYDVFRRWYVDGRLYYLAILDPKNPLLGIREMRYLDPRKIRKIRQIKNIKDKKVNMPMTKVESEFYIYSDKALLSGPAVQLQNFSSTSTGIKISKDSIVHVTSGLTNAQGSMVTSYLQKAIKPLNMLRSMEDSLVIYRISRAPERRIFYIDVGNLPHIKAEQYVKDIMTKHKNKLVYNAETGEIKDDRKFMCYALETTIPLLDGRTLTLEEIINEYQDGKQNWVYSCDPSTGKFVPGPVSWAGITKKDSQVVKVTFDNGKSVICTPDHKFPVWGKGFVEAQHLVGESIIPGYRRMQKMYNNGAEYEQIFKNETKKWEYTHREVARWKESVGIREEMIHKVEFSDSTKNTIHHVDYNRYNNSPFNLKMMNRDDHIQYHWDMAKFGAGRRKNKSEDFTPEWREKLSNARKGKVNHCKTWKIITPDQETLIIENLSKYCFDRNLNRTNIKSKFGSKKYFAEELRNHKAVSVEWLEQKIDVGCLTVDLEETYHSHHTYLLDAGVYTKNTMLEDYYIPRREGGKGTQIDTLPGGQSLGQIDDIKYFLNKLYGALNVPQSRMNPEYLYDIGRSTQITRDEVKFSKFIDRLRLKFSTVFLSVLEKNLILKRVLTPEEWQEISYHIQFKYHRDNYWSELKDQEIMTSRMNVATVVEPFVGKYFSHKTMRTKILRQSEKDIEQNDEEIAEEISNPQFNPPIEDDPNQQ